MGVTAIEAIDEWYSASVGTRRRPVLLVAMLILMAVVVIEPVGVLGHFLHDHIGAHAHWGDAGGFHPSGGNAPDDDHHWHHLMVPADLAESGNLRAPHAVVTGVAGDRRGHVVSAPFLPFSPPRG